MKNNCAKAEQQHYAAIRKYESWMKRNDSGVQRLWNVNRPDTVQAPLIS